jgi:hypothetical protein
MKSKLYQQKTGDGYDCIVKILRGRLRTARTRQHPPLVSKMPKPLVVALVFDRDVKLVGCDDTNATDVWLAQQSTTWVTSQLFGTLARHSWNCRKMF